VTQLWCFKNAQSRTKAANGTTTGRETLPFASKTSRVIPAGAKPCFYLANCLVRAIAKACQDRGQRNPDKQEVDNLVSGPLFRGSHHGN
jgi:hypothetical protein